MKKRIMYGSELIGEFPCELDLNKDISSIVNPPIYISIRSNVKKPIFDFQQTVYAEWSPDSWNTHVEATP